MHLSLSSAVFAALVASSQHVLGAHATTPRAPAPAPAPAVSNSTAAPSAAAPGINLGSTFDNSVAWVGGVSPGQCNNVAIAASGTNPCDHAFTLNGMSFTVNGCGGAPWITHGSTFWA